MPGKFILAAISLFAGLGVAIGIAAPTPYQATLSWSDNSVNELGFMIERSTGGEVFELIATTPANVSVYTDATVSPGELYFYRVCAFNAAGRSRYTSPAAFRIAGPETFADWRLRQLGPLADLLRIAGGGDGSILAKVVETSLPVSNDFGLPDLVCYAHGINPFAPDLSLLPRTKISFMNGRLVQTVEFALSKSAMGLTFRPMISKDLTNWQPIPFKTTKIRENGSHRWARLTLPDLESVCYFRLQISESTP